MLVENEIIPRRIDTLDEAIRIHSKAGAEKADLAESLTYSANAWHGLGRDDVAESMHRRILALDRKIFHGAPAPQVSQDMINLGEVQSSDGRVCPSRTE